MVRNPRENPRPYHQRWAPNTDAMMGSMLWTYGPAMVVPDSRRRSATHSVKNGAAEVPDRLQGAYLSLTDGLPRLRVPGRKERPGGTASAGARGGGIATGF